MATIRGDGRAAPAAHGSPTLIGNTLLVVTIPLDEVADPLSRLRELLGDRQLSRRLQRRVQARRARRAVQDHRAEPATVLVHRRHRERRAGHPVARSTSMRRDSPCPDPDGVPGRPLRHVRVPVTRRAVARAPASRPTRPRARCSGRGCGATTPVLVERPAARRSSGSSGASGRRFCDGLPAGHEPRALH